MNRERFGLFLFIFSDLAIILFVFGNCMITAECQPQVEPNPTRMINQKLQEASTATTTTTHFLTTTSSVDECTLIKPSNGVNVTCEDCIANNKCFFCEEDSSCRKLTFDGIFPSGCKASSARWFSCGLDLQALMIGAAALGFVVILITFCCLCYCFNSTCKAISNSSYNRVQKRILKQRTALKMMNEERRQERTARNDAMRAKYGLKPPTYANLQEE